MIVRLARGSSRILRLRIRNRNTKKPVNLNLCHVNFVVKELLGDDEVLLFKTSSVVDLSALSNVILKTEPLDGIAVVMIAEDDTRELGLGTYKFSVWLDRLDKEELDGLGTYYNYPENGKLVLYDKGDNNNNGDEAEGEDAGDDEGGGGING